MFKKGHHPKNEFKKGHKGYWFGKKQPKELVEKRSKKLIGKPPTSGCFKKGHKINWIDGSSFLPYTEEFTKELKLKIRIRDNYTCQLCEKTEREELEELNRVLSIHHIDFNKNNCKENNLTALCMRCNIKVNRQREYWTDYFQSKLL